MFSSSIIFNPVLLKDIVDYYLEQDAFVFDVETMGENRGVPQVNQVAWMSLATHGHTCAIPMGHPNGDVMLKKPSRKKNLLTKTFEMFPAEWDEPPEQMFPSEVFGILEPLFMSETILKVAHNAPFDLISVAKYFGEIPPPPYDDTIVMAWLLDENRRLGLKDLTIKEYRRKYDSENVGRKIEVHPFSKTGRYAYLDAKYTWLHWLRQRPMLTAENLDGVYQLEMDTLGVNLDVGAEGTPVDEEGLHELESDLTVRRVEYEGDMYKAAGKKFNVNSNPQKVQILYGPKSEGNQGLKPWKLTKGGMQKKKENKEITLSDYSTDAESLEKFESNKVVAALLKYQEVDRVLGTYVHGYLGVPGDPKRPRQIFDGRVYPEFVQYGTVTGRESCRTPNLQNLPRADTELGKRLRSCIIAGRGYKLIVADYGQIELVVLAHYVGYGALYDGFYAGIDPHTTTAAIVFDKDPVDLLERIKDNDLESKKIRQVAKNLNFAVVYGAGPEKVATMSKTSVSNAKRFMAIHERGFPEIYSFKERAIDVCRSRKPPHLVTLAGRKRRLPSIWSKDFGTRSKAERQAINSLIQGSSADLLKVAGARANAALREEDTGRILLKVHDELVVRAREETADKAAVLIKEAMTGSGIQKWIDVPLRIDLNIADDWASAK